jgi:uncharacterized membrane protein YbhN (UPF0104 family)
VGIRRILSYVLLVMIAAMAVLYFMGHREEFHIIGAVSGGAVVLLSVLQLFSGIFYGLQQKILTDHYKLNLNFFQWYGLIRATSFANLWLPFAAGTSVKALYLKKVHNLDYSSFIALTAVMNLIKFMVNSLFACILLLVTIRSAPPFLFAPEGTQAEQDGGQQGEARLHDSLRCTMSGDEWGGRCSLPLTTAGGPVTLVAKPYNSHQLVMA